MAACVCTGGGFSGDAPLWLEGAPTTLVFGGQVGSLTLLDVAGIQSHFFKAVNSHSSFPGDSGWKL